MKVDEYQINIDLLPKALQQELIEYYKYLLFKHRKRTAKQSREKDFFSSVNKHKFTLPENYHFDRNIANER